MTCSPFRLIVTEDENAPTPVPHTGGSSQTRAAAPPIGSGALAHGKGEPNRNIQSTVVSGPPTQLINLSDTSGVLPKSVTFPRTTPGVFAPEFGPSVAGTEVFQPNTGSVGLGQIPVTNGSNIAVATAIGQMPVTVDTDIPVAVQIKPTPRTVATGAPATVVTATTALIMGTPTVALTTTTGSDVRGGMPE